MPRATRSSAKAASSEPNNEPDMKHDIGGRKRKAQGNDSPSATPGKKTKKEEPEKDQKTLEQTLPSENGNDTKGGKEEIEDADMNDAAEKVEAENADAAQGQAAEQINGATETRTNGHEKASAKDDDDKEESKGEVADSTQNSAAAKEQSAAEATTQAQSKAENGSGAIESSQKRGDAQPRNLLEKGLIYFFIRPRVGTESADGVNDIARSYIVLRPLPHDAKLTSGTIDDLKNNRLLALPKKVLPRSGQDRFMSFVEKAGISVQELKDEFMVGSTYETATTGVRHTPPVTPVGEGVYSITDTGRETHLAYMLTIPKELGQVQEELGLTDQGSYVLSVKNPETKGPANTSLPQGPDFPKEIMEEFRNLRWMPLQPKHLNYPNAQFLLIGGRLGELGKAVEPDERDKKDDNKETPEEEMKKLEDEDEVRVEGLNGDDTIFDDLAVSKKDFPDVQTTW